MSATIPSNWLRFAKEDLQAAEVLMRGEQFNQACFHAQQSVERVLKALLQSKGMPIPKICLITELLEMCYPVDENLKSFEVDAQWMDKYYHSTRYPDADPATLPANPPQQEETDRALRIAKQIFEYALKRHFKEHKIILLY
ncbi:MAG: HEPN domain-containing protein [Gemmatimonadetes bacterium]|nr:MAG: HEPN domain-containing protein [Gemmatimonadota bacterium]